jgi:hypothetical protein
VSGKAYCGTKIGPADLQMRGIGADYIRVAMGVAIRLLGAAAGCEDSGRERNRGVTGITLKDRVPLPGRAHSIRYLLWMSGSQRQASST